MKLTLIILLNIAGWFVWILNDEIDLIRITRVAKPNHEFVRISHRVRCVSAFNAHIFDIYVSRDQFAKTDNWVKIFNKRGELIEEVPTDCIRSIEYSDQILKAPTEEEREKSRRQKRRRNRLRWK